MDAPQLDEALESLRAVCGEVGVRRTVVVRRGWRVWAGPEPDVRVPVYSCTKSFLSVCLGLLWDDGRCSPDDLAYRYFEPLQRHYPTVTLRHLATFTSGYAHAPESVFKPAEPMYSPGAAFHYSDQSDLLALILTRIAGEPLRELFQRRIGDAIGLRPEAWEWRVVGETEGIPVHGGSGFPESGVHIAAQDLARLGWMAACRGVWAGRRLLSLRYFETAAAPCTDPRTPPYDPKAWYVRLPGAYGLNWWVNGVTPDGQRMWPHAPPDTFAAQGNLNGICFALPSWEMTIVRLGPDVVIDMRLYDRMFQRLKAMRPPLDVRSSPSGAR
jgi:CubicO group peptidase (beta-lactamase class C family)